MHHLRVPTRIISPLLFLPLSLVAACEGGPPALEDAVAELSIGACTARRIDAFSTGADEGRLVFSTDGRTAYFHRADGGPPQIYESRRAGAGWSTPQLVPFASGHVEFDPFLSIDGRTLYYTSFRPVAGTEARPDGDLWKVERTAGGWSAPIHLGPEVNTDANEFFPTVTADGTLFFNSDRAGGVGAWDLYRARRAGGGFAPAALLPGDVNTGIWEFNPTLTPGGRLLAFGSLDPDPAAPYSDIFFSLKLGGEYSARVDAGPCINTVIEEYHPTIDWARGRLVFVRWTPETQGDFYEVSLPAALLALM